MEWREDLSERVKEREYAYTIIEELCYEDMSVIPVILVAIITSFPFHDFTDNLPA